MAFLDTFTNHPPGFVDYHRDLPTLSDSSTRASQYLRFFQQVLCRQPA